MLGHIDAQRTQRVFVFGNGGGGDRFTFAHVAQPSPRRVNRLRELSIPAREEHLLPAPQLLVQPLMPSGLCGLAFQAAALLLDFEDDVVDAREVLLRGLELELGGAAAGLVLGDAGRLFDQLPPIGGPRRQDQANLSLLDDCVGLGAQARVHQQLVDVLQATVLAVDQVFTLARSIEPSNQFDITSGGAELLEHVLGRRRFRRELPTGARSVAMAIAVGPRNLHRHRAARQRGHAAQSQPHFGGAGRLACVATAEDDVFHLFAAEAARALLAQHPRNRVGDVALAAPVGTDDGGDPAIEGELRAVGKGFEAGDFKAFKPHACLGTCRSAGPWNRSASTGPWAHRFEERARDGSRTNQASVEVENPTTWLAPGAGLRLGRTAA